MKKTALITGASGGLGLEFAKLCAADGCDLVLVARNANKLVELKDEIVQSYGVKVNVCPCDLSKADAALDILKYTQSNAIDIDVLINNAGFGDAGSFAESSWQKQYEMVQVNIIALMQLTHCYLKPMISRGYGRILNLSSVAAFSAGPDMSVYYASKAFVKNFSEAVAEETRGTGVTVTALCPGPTSTGFEKAAAMKKGSVMFRRAANAADVAAAGIEAMKNGSVLCYQGCFTKLMSIGARLVPRSLTRKFARTMNN